MGTINDTTSELFVGKGDCREEFKVVNCRGNIVFATDGMALCVRAKTAADGESDPAAKLPDVAAVIEQMNLRGTYCSMPLPAFDVQPCECGGKITEEREECPECDGEGVIECSECGHEHDCTKCNGAGEIVITPECKRCRGAGVLCPDAVRGERYDTLDIGGVWVQLEYYACLRQLPAVLVCVVRNDSYGHLVFRSGEYYGAVMGVRRR